MTRFILRRLFAMIPTLFGITLVTFIVLNLSMSAPTSGVFSKTSTRALPHGATFDDRNRFPDLHLPLFINLSINDARSYAMRELDRLEDAREANQAKRVLVRVGGAWLPHVLPKLESVSAKQRRGMLDALSQIAPRLGLEKSLEAAPDAVAFWRRYWEIYRSDFKPVRVARLVRRLIRRDDPLAVSEIYNLDTYALHN